MEVERMNTQENQNQLFENEAKNLSSKYDYTYDDSLSALNRSFKYYKDIGENDESAIDGAMDMVAEAVMIAPSQDFDELRGMVDYMLFSIHHRVVSRRG
jgi:hypothetical protein